MSIIQKRLSTESTSRSEKALFDAAVCLADGWNVWMNARLNFSVSRSGAHVDREVDCILYHKKYGMLLIECKDGQISTEAASGSVDGFVWKQGSRVMERSPVDQVQSIIYPLHDHFSEMFPKEDGCLNRVRVQWAVCFSDMDGMEKIGSNALQPRRVILKSDLKSYNTLERKIKKILETPEASRGGNPFPNDELSDVNYDKLISFLGCFDEPTWPELWDMQAASRVQPTAIQEMLMESIVRNPRMRIEGVAGSGKSLLVQWEATRLAREGKRVAVLCYNDLLAEHIQKNFEEAGLDESLVVAESFMKLAQKYVRLAKVPEFPRKEPADSLQRKEYYEALPAAFFRALKILRNQKKNRFFDALIIDEGQDFENSWLDACLNLLKDPDEGMVRFFYDSKQTLYDGRAVLGNVTFNKMPVMVLKRGFRSTKRILNWVQDETDIRIPCYEDTPIGRNVDVQVYSDPSEQFELLEKTVKKLNAKGVENKDILVVSLCSRRHSALADLRNDNFVWSDVKDSLNSIAINIVSAYRYKGLDKPVVILTDLDSSKNDPGAPHDKAHLIMVGATRAKEHLVVFRQRNLV